jgi:hypothetical protein
MSKRYAGYLIEASEVGTMVPEIKSEAVARELAPLKNEPENSRA